MHHHHPRGFSFNKLKNKVVHRHSTDSNLDTIHGNNNRRNSLDNNTNNSILHNNKHNSHSNHHSYFHKSETPPREHISAASRLRSTSLTFHHDSSKHNNNTNNNNSLDSPRSRSRSRSKSSTNHHSQTLSPSNIFKSNKTKELIKQETSNVLSKKLINMLNDIGLQQPIPLKTTTSGSLSKTVKIYVSNSNDCIYLPPAVSTSFTYEDVENGGNVQRSMDESLTTSSSSSSLINEAQLVEDQFPNTNTRSSSLSTSNTMIDESSIIRRMKKFHSPNYLNSKIDSDLPIPHTFAVIIEITKDLTTSKDLIFKFQSSTQILWPTGDAYNRSQVKEKFKIGDMEWNTNFQNADYFISSLNSNDFKLKNIGPDDLARRSREYKLIDNSKTSNSKDDEDSSPPPTPQPQQSTSSSSSLNESESTTSHTFPHSHSNSQFNSEHKAGLYVFLLPILLPEHIPPSIVSINGTLSHTLSINFNKISDKLNRKLKVNASYAIPMVRTPPNFANSIADKPIYVNRVWNDSVHYMITFPKKYISLGSEHVINVKLVPLVKDVILKRIKFNVLERITYVSKNLKKEYDYDSEDPNFLHPANKENKIRERIISLCELKTKHKQSSNSMGDSYKEEIIKCPDNNLLFSCYEPENDLNNNNNSKKKNNNKDKDKTMIASPIDINIALPFLTTKTDKFMMTSSSSTSPTSTSFLDDDPITTNTTNTSFSNSTTTSTTATNSTSRKASVVDTTNSLNSPSSPIIGALETNLSNVDEIGLHDQKKHPISQYLSDDLLSKSQPPENIKNGYTLISRALYPDSNFKHIQINHRLQICFRISKPDPKDDFKMHHYEVVVDTPLILLSSKCNDGSIQLPKYNEVELTSNSINNSSSTSSNSASSNGISFNTPNYKNIKNGIIIKPWNPNEESPGSGGGNDEQLPSFEEAITTSTISNPSSPSPLFKTLSIPEDPLSRIPSIPMILPNEPAPAYEIEDQSSLSPTPTPPNASLQLQQQPQQQQQPVHQHQQQQPRDSVSSLNIDEIVNINDKNLNLNQVNNSIGNLERRQSSIKESLSQSFKSNHTINNSNQSNQQLNQNKNVESSSRDDDDEDGSIQSSSSSSLLLNHGINTGVTGIGGVNNNNNDVGGNGNVDGRDGEGVSPPSSTVPDSTSIVSSLSNEQRSEENQENNSTNLPGHFASFENREEFESSDNEEAILDDEDEDDDDALINDGLDDERNEESDGSDDDDDENLVINSYQPQFSTSSSNTINTNGEISKIISEDSDDDEDENDNEINKNKFYKDENDYNEDDENEEEMKFNQRLPLLKHISTESIKTINSTTSYISSPNLLRYPQQQQQNQQQRPQYMRNNTISSSTLSLNQQQRQSTDNLSLVPVSTSSSSLLNLKPQDIQHFD
ncbi:ECM21 [Candida pseudojiufengensis]|uniref:ECM21 n=1 Tax=Candida pseudojiufengensis TaxID=497109 RepID=UPI0022241D81|nr:ECM21 [Candida pseudojiufengensis]KAI5963752.1 ECM21 [Candida pseudojiufengensis]